MTHRHTPRPLRGYREANQLTQQEVADRLGVTRQTVAAWESGEHRPTVEALVSLARIYHVHVLDFSEAQEG